MEFSGFITNTNWPSEEDIAEAHLLERELPRNWSCFNFSNCDHYKTKIVMVGNYEIEMCLLCGESIHKLCIHDCEWNISGTLLRCKNCGMDCT